MTCAGLYEEDLVGIRSGQAKGILANINECIAHGMTLDSLNKNGAAFVSKVMDV